MVSQQGLALLQEVLSWAQVIVGVAVGDLVVEGALVVVGIIITMEVEVTVAVGDLVIVVVAGGTLVTTVGGYAFSQALLVTHFTVKPQVAVFQVCRTWVSGQGL